MSEAVRVHFSSQVDDNFLLLPTTELMVTPGIAVDFGLMEKCDPEGKPVALDVIVEAHKLFLGDKFTPETCSEYLEMQSRHWLGRAFGKKAYYSGYMINGCYAYDLESVYVKDRGYKGLSFDRARIHEGDLVEVFVFQDSDGMDYYTYFLMNGIGVKELRLAMGEEVELELEGLMFGYGGPLKKKERASRRLISTVSDSQLVTVDIQNGEMTPIEGTMTDDDGLFGLSFNEPGTYYVSCVGGECRFNAHIAHPWLKVVVG